MIDEQGHDRYLDKGSLVVFRVESSGVLLAISKNGHFYLVDW